MICGRNTAFEKMHRKSLGEEWDSPQKKYKKKKKREYRHEREIKRSWDDTN